MIVQGSAVDPREAAAERGYNAFVESLAEWLPPGGAQTWRGMHPRVRAAWMHAVEAAHAQKP